MHQISGVKHSLMKRAAALHLKSSAPVICDHTHGFSPGEQGWRSPGHIQAQSQSSPCSLPLHYPVLASQLGSELLLYNGGYKKTLYRHQEVAVTVVTEKYPALHLA